MTPQVASKRHFFVPMFLYFALEKKNNIALQPASEMVITIRKALFQATKNKIAVKQKIYKLLIQFFTLHTKRRFFIRPIESFPVLRLECL